MAKNNGCNCQGQTHKCYEEADDADASETDERDILVVSGSENDESNTTNEEVIMTRVWDKVRPPENILERSPVVSARQLQLIRAQIYGKMSLKKH